MEDIISDVYDRLSALLSTYALDDVEQSKDTIAGLSELNTGYAHILQVMHNAITTNEVMENQMHLSTMLSPHMHNTHYLENIPYHMLGNYIQNRNDVLQSLDVNAVHLTSLVDQDIYNDVSIDGSLIVDGDMLITNVINKIYANTLSIDDSTSIFAISSKGNSLLSYDILTNMVVFDKDVHASHIQVNDVYVNHALAAYDIYAEVDPNNIGLLHANDAYYIAEANDLLTSYEQSSTQIVNEAIMFGFIDYTAYNRITPDVNIPSIVYSDSSTLLSYVADINTRYSNVPNYPVYIDLHSIDTLPNHNYDIDTRINALLINENDISQSVSLPVTLTENISVISTSLNAYINALPVTHPGNQLTYDAKPMNDYLLNLINDTLDVDVQTLPNIPAYNSLLHMLVNTIDNINALDMSFNPHDLSVPVVYANTIGDTYMDVNLINNVYAVSLDMNGISIYANQGDIVINGDVSMHDFTVNGIAFSQLNALLGTKSNMLNEQQQLTANLIGYRANINANIDTALLTSVNESLVIDINIHNSDVANMYNQELTYIDVINDINARVIDVNSIQDISDILSYTDHLNDVYVNTLAHDTLPNNMKLTANDIYINGAHGIIYVNDLSEQARNDVITLYNDTLYYWSGQWKNMANETVELSDTTGLINIHTYTNIADTYYLLNDITYAVNGLTDTYLLTLNEYNAVRDATQVDVQLNYAMQVNDKVTYILNDINTVNAYNYITSDIHALINYSAYVNANIVSKQAGIPTILDEQAYAIYVNDRVSTYAINEEVLPISQLNDNVYALIEYGDAISNSMLTYNRAYDGILTGTYVNLNNRQMSLNTLYDNLRIYSTNVSSMHVNHILPDVNYITYVNDLIDTKLTSMHTWNHNISNSIAGIDVLNAMMSVNYVVDLSALSTSINDIVLSRKEYIDMNSDYNRPHVMHELTLLNNLTHIDTLSLAGTHAVSSMSFDLVKLVNIQTIQASPAIDGGPNLNGVFGDNEYSVSTGRWDSVAVLDTTIKSGTYYQYNFKNNSTRGNMDHGCMIGWVDLANYASLSDVSQWAIYSSFTGGNGLTVHMTGNSFMYNTVNYDSNGSNVVYDVPFNDVNFNIAGMYMQLGIKDDTVELIFIDTDGTTIRVRKRFTLPGLDYSAGKVPFFATNHTSVFIESAPSPTVLPYRGTLTSLSYYAESVNVNNLGVRQLTADNVRALSYSQASSKYEYYESVHPNTIIKYKGEYIFTDISNMRDNINGYVSNVNTRNQQLLSAYDSVDQALSINYAHFINVDIELDNMQSYIAGVNLLIPDKHDIIDQQGGVDITSWANSIVQNYIQLSDTVVNGLESDIIELNTLVNTYNDALLTLSLLPNVHADSLIVNNIYDIGNALSYQFNDILPNFSAAYTGKVNIKSTDEVNIGGTSKWLTLYEPPYTPNISIPTYFDPTKTLRDVSVVDVVNKGGIPNGYTSHGDGTFSIDNFNGMCIFDVDYRNNIGVSIEMVSGATNSDPVCVSMIDITHVSSVANVAQWALQQSLTADNGFSITMQNSNTYPTRYNGGNHNAAHTYELPYIIEVGTTITAFISDNAFYIAMTSPTGALRTYAHIRQFESLTVPNTISPLYQNNANVYRLGFSASNGSLVWRLKSVNANVVGLPKHFGNIYHVSDSGLSSTKPLGLLIGKSPKNGRYGGAGGSEAANSIPGGSIGAKPTVFLPWGYDTMAGRNRFGRGIHSFYKCPVSHAQPTLRNASENLPVMRSIYSHFHLVNHTNQSHYTESTINMRLGNAQYYEIKGSNNNAFGGASVGFMFGIINARAISSTELGNGYKWEETSRYIGDSTLMYSWYNNNFLSIYSKTGAANLVVTQNVQSISNRTFRIQLGVTGNDVEWVIIDSDDSTICARDRRNFGHLNLDANYVVPYFRTYDSKVYDVPKTPLSYRGTLTGLSYINDTAPIIPAMSVYRGLLPTHTIDSNISDCVVGNKYLMKNTRGGTSVNSGILLDAPMRLDTYFEIELVNGSMAQNEKFSIGLTYPYIGRRIENYGNWGEHVDISRNKQLVLYFDSANVYLHFDGATPQNSAFTINNGSAMDPGGRIQFAINDTGNVIEICRSNNAGTLLDRVHFTLGTPIKNTLEYVPFFGIASTTNVFASPTSVKTYKGVQLTPIRCLADYCIPSIPDNDSYHFAFDYTDNSNAIRTNNDKTIKIGDYFTTSNFDACGMSYELRNSMYKYTEWELATHITSNKSPRVKMGLISETRRNNTPASNTWAQPGTLSQNEGILFETATNNTFLYFHYNGGGSSVGWDYLNSDYTMGIGDRYQMGIDDRYIEICLVSKRGNVMAYKKIDYAGTLFTSIDAYPIFCPDTINAFRMPLTTWAYKGSLMNMTPLVSSTIPPSHSTVYESHCVLQTSRCVQNKLLIDKRNASVTYHDKGTMGRLSMVYEGTALPSYDLYKHIGMMFSNTSDNKMYVGTHDGWKEI